MVDFFRFAKFSEILLIFLLIYLSLKVGFFHSFILSSQIFCPFFGNFWKIFRINEFLLAFKKKKKHGFLDMFIFWHFF